MELAELNRPNMNKKNLIQLVKSFVLLPIATVSLSFGSITKDNYDIAQVPQAVLSQKQNIEADGFIAFNQVMSQRPKDSKSKADAIDAYFRLRNMPLKGMGMKMVEEAKKNGLDWRLLPAIATIESTGGIYACQRVDHNFFGWGSCKIGFNSDEEAIEIIAHNLGGNNYNTDQYYADKTTKEILQRYNPPSVVPNYADKVMSVMDAIGENETVIVNA